MAIIILDTQACVVCGRTSHLEITEEEAAALKAGKFVQDAMPNRDADFRELVITGTHPECWDKLFPEEEDE